MAFTLRWTTGSDASLDRDNQTRTRKGEIVGTLPYSGPQDAFDYIADAVNAWVTSTLPTYSTNFGTLFLNSIQLSERHYAQHYEFSASYSPFPKQTGTYQITVDQAVGNVHVTAGVRIAGYPVATCPNGGGTFFDGQEVTGCDVPVAEDRIAVSYRHPQAFLNAAYIRNVGKLRGYPNSDVFLGYAPGEVRYMGGNFTQSDCEASASYSFEISPNVTNLVVGTITVAEKSGFDVLSPRYKPTTNTVGGSTYAVRQVEFIEVIRPREHKAYKSVFGWG